MKTVFTIKSFKGYRLVKDVIKQIAIEYSNVDIQWVDKDILNMVKSKIRFGVL